MMVSRPLACVWIILAGLLTACQTTPQGIASSAGPKAGTTSSQSAASSGLATKASSSEAWKQLLEAAKREGALTVYAGAGGDSRTEIEAFAKEYPELHVEAVYAPGSGLVSRLNAERTAGKYLADIVTALGGSAILSLKPQGALAPLQPALVLPEVLDLSAWQENRLWWIDSAEPYTTLAFVGIVQTMVSYNTNLVDPKEMKSYWDLLNPTWKGRIVSAEPRSGPGPTRWAYIYKHADLGETFLRRLLNEMNVTFSEDPRQMADWLAQGRFAMGFNILRPSLLQAINQGLPIKIMPSDQFREGEPLTASAGTVSLADRAPHPNAAKVFLNWLLSRDGQLAWQKLVGQNSLRTDIGKDGISDLPKSGVKHVSTSTEEMTRLGDEVSRLMDRLLEKSNG